VPAELARLEALPSPEGADEAVFLTLKAELARVLSAQGVERFVSAPPMLPGSSAYLSWDSDISTLSWGYKCAGDYNQDSLVGVNDITPLGQNYLAEVPGDPNSVLAVIDGNGDGLITVNDITQIGQNYGVRVTGYSVYASSALSDYPASAASDNGGAALLGSVPFPSGPPPADQRRMFSFEVTEPQPETYFWVRPTDGSSEGTPSSYCYLGEPDNEPPAAFLVADPTSGDPPLPVSFDASLSQDPDGAIVKYEWDWDGATNGWEWEDSGSTAALQHTFTSAGTWQTTVRVTDDLGATDSTSLPILVHGPNVAPVAALAAEPESGEAPLSISLNATASYDSDGTIEYYEWDLDGDGTYGDSAAEAAAAGKSTVDYTYMTAGTHMPGVRVTDDDGATDTDGVELTVSAPPNIDPIAALTADPWWGVPSLVVSFDAGGSFDPDGTIEDYEWDFDDDEAYGEAGEEADAAGSSAVEVTYAEVGTYTVSVRVTDNRSATAEIAVEVYVVPAGGDPAWTTWRHDLRHTGRSPCVGPQTRHIKWGFTTGDRILSSPAVGADGTVYLASYDNNIYALNADGSLKWTFATEGWTYSSPAVGADGTVYVGSTDNKFYAIKPDGSLKWSYLTGDRVVSSPAIAADGTVYVGGNDCNFYAFEPDGDVKWSYPGGAEFKHSSPAIAADGTIYAGCFDYKLYAFWPSGSLRWTYPTAGELVSTPAIAADGTIYVGSCDSTLYAIKPDGSQKWTYDTEDVIQSSPAIGEDGTVYVGSWDTNLHAVNPDGSPKWKFAAGAEVWSSPAIDALGTIYVGSNDGKLYAINPDGSLSWSNTMWDPIWSSPALGPDGTLYIGCDDFNLYAFGPDA